MLIPFSSLGNRGSVDENKDSNTEDETVVDGEQGNGMDFRLLVDCLFRDVLTCCRVVLMHIISQLRPGADLSRVTLPTFILEPRSMLERITK
jgi:hypothetical protein